MKKFLFLLVLLLTAPMYLPVSSSLSPDTYSLPQNWEESYIEENRLENHFSLIEDSLPERHYNDIQESHYNIQDSKLEDHDTALEDSRLHEHNIDIKIQDSKLEAPKPIKREQPFEQARPKETAEEHKHLAHQQRNSKTDNLNILFIGADRDGLLMTAIYSINYKGKKENFKSGSVFFPGNMQIIYDGKTYLLQELFKDLGKDDYSRIMVNILEQLMDIHIAYHVIIDKAVLTEAEKILDPIIVDGTRINLEDIFEMPASDKDKTVLGQLMEQFTRPTAFFYKLPALVIKSSRHIKTDFPLTPENLWLHFRIARDVNREEIDKVILDKNIPEDILKDIIYRITN
ncbi:hypothetical protein [Desulfitibacter alkalitolerans]|uniref:hypothetical protein n=1 Tax=Desulfitibacter alkalitolerans TaxID=264641 RepID=UPI0004845DF7|nr:hypothetical protein [Desulfitibacter alkalitolerans]